LVPSPPGSITPATSNGVVKNSTTWTGGVLERPAGTWQYAYAEFLVPEPKLMDSSQKEAYAGAWVGIDGDTCRTAILQAGIDMEVNNKGKVTYTAWYEWFPDYSHDFSGFPINFHDTIQVTVVAASPTSGYVALRNADTGKVVSKLLTSSHALCQQDVEWIVEDPTIGNSLGPLANFGGVVFLEATAVDTNGNLARPQNGTAVVLVRDNKALTDVFLGDRYVAVNWINN